MILSTKRLVYFSDCVLTIAITIMVFDVGANIARSLNFSQEIPHILAYILSFVTLATFWVGHHNFFHFTKKTDVKLLWYNLHVLFWLSNVPFATSLLGNYPSFPSIIVLYGTVMFMVSFSFALSRRYVIKHIELIGPAPEKTPPSVYKVAQVKQAKARIALVLYLVSVPAAFFSVITAYACIIAPIVLYLMPDEANRLPKIGWMVHRSHHAAK